MTATEWGQWCSQFDALHNEVLGLHHSRRMWRTVRSMIETNPAVRRSGIAEYWMNQSYSVCQLVAVRRQTDGRKGVVSLHRSLDHLARKPSMVTRAWFSQELESNPKSRPYAASLAAGFDDFADPGQAQVKASSVAADRDQLTAAADRAKQVVDESLAHLADPTRGGTGPPAITWGDLDIAVDTIGNLYKKYYRLSHPGAILGNLEPNLPPGWDRIFETAWKPIGFSAGDPPAQA